ncbi:Endothelial differentiation- factor 1 [Mitosporidium daphniae]
MDTSDWEKVTVLRKKKLPPQHSTKAVNEALAKGSPVEISKRYNAGTNRPSASTPSAEQRHIAESDEIILPRTISHDVGRAIMRARQAIPLTQKELATKIFEKPDIIHDYELGKGLYNPTILAKIERVLGVKLRGTNIGAPLNVPKRAK